MIETNKIYYGHCADLINQMPEDFIDLVFTSPPYYNARDYSNYSSVEEYMKEMKKIFTLLLSKIKPSRMCVINIAPVLIERESRSEQSYRIPLPFYFVPMMEQVGFEFLEDIIWMKPEGAALNRNGGFFLHRKPVAYKPNIITEYILVFKKPAPFLIDKVLKNDSLVEDDYERTNVWNINPDTRSDHPAPFPESLAEKIIRYYSYEAELIYDPFGGSGTVGKMAYKLRRKYIVSEINYTYCKIAQQRINSTQQNIF